MLRPYLIILILQFGLIFHGCAALERLDGSSEEEIRRFKMSKDELRNEIKKMEIANADLQRQIHTLRRENQRIRDEYEDNAAGMRGQNELLSEQIDKLQKETQALTSQNQILATRLTQLQLKPETPSSKAYEEEKHIQGLRMKVLSGDGDLNSAVEMAKKLGSMGFKIELIHYAPRSNFLHNTVYSKPECQNQAKRLVLTLGGNTIFKRLKWRSAFDIIVVTGRTPSDRHYISS